MLNLGDYISFSDLFSVCLRTNDHLNLKMWMYLVGILQVLRSKVQDFEKFELSPMSKSDVLVHM